MGTDVTNDAVDKLYQSFYLVSDAKDNVSEHSNEYKQFIAAVKGQPKERILASQFITRFFKHFPELAHEAIEALVDLCEDDDVQVRKQAIKDLPSLCRDNKNYTQKISDILAQLLQTEDNSELAIVNNSLVTLLKLNAKACLAGLFTQILQGEDVVREKCLRFLCNKVKGPNKELITNEAEDLIISEAKKVLQDVTAVEFNLVMEVLGNTRLSSTISGQQELVELVAEQAEIGQPFVPTQGEESELLDRIINCVRVALPYFSSKIPSTKFLEYVLSEVMTRLDKLVPGDGQEATELDIFKIVAELAMNTGALDNPHTHLQTIFNRLLVYLPLPPEDLESEGQEPKLEFSHVECLMYSFHQLLKQDLEYLKDPDVLKDFRLRLQYFARGIQGYIKKLREALSGKSDKELKSDENNIKVVALRTTNNINTLIKDLFHCPPSVKARVVLSWKFGQPQGPQPVVAQKEVSAPTETGTKRHPPITFDGKADSNSGSPPKRSRELYQPPGGKYSTSMGSLSNRGSRTFRGGRGRFRGGGRGRRW